MAGKPANTLITLTVTTDGISTDPTNINNHVVFTDNQSDPVENPGHPDTYVSTVNKNADCEWQGVAKNGTDEINIISVVKKNPNGKDILKTPIPPGLQNPNGGNKLTAKVRGNYIKDNENYTVTFNINGTGPEYPVDPVIKMNS